MSDADAPLHALVAVDAPRVQRVAGVVTSLMGIMTLPLALSVVGPHGLRHHTIAVPAFALAASGLLFFAGLGVTASAGRSMERPRSKSKGVIARTEHELLVSTERGSWAIPFETIRSAHFIAAQHTLVLSAEDGTRVAIEAADETASARLLAGLGLDGSVTLELAAQDGPSRAVEGCAAGVAGLFVGLLLMLGVVVGVDAFAKRAFFALTAPGLLIAALTPILFTIRWVAGFGETLKVQLGTEGALVRQGKEELYIAYHDVVSIEACDRGVLVRQKSGADPFIRTAEPLTLAAALQERVADQPAESRRIASLARAGASVDTWMARLSEIAKANARYRVQHVDAEQLASIVEDPRASLEERVGAAYILGEKREATFVERARVAASRSAHPLLRSALLAAVEGEIEELAIEEACAALDESGPHPRAVESEARAPLESNAA